MAALGIIEEMERSHSLMSQADRLGELEGQRRSLMVVHSVLHAVGASALEKIGNPIPEEVDPATYGRRAASKYIKNIQRIETGPVSMNPWGMQCDYALGRVITTHKRSLRAWDSSDLYIGEVQHDGMLEPQHVAISGLNVVFTHRLSHYDYGQKPDENYRASLSRFGHLLDVFVKAADIDLPRYNTPDDIPMLSRLPLSRSVWSG